MRQLIKSFIVVTLGSGLALGVGACGKGNEVPAKVASAPTTLVTMLAKPSGTPVLEIDRADAEPVSVDFATLDRLAKQHYKIVEPFEKKLINFNGVELWSVLAGAGVPETATSVQMTALDDYQVVFSVADIRKGGVILATRGDGELIPLDHGGPTRLVFVDGNAAGSNPDQWIWSIKTIVVS